MWILSFNLPKVFDSIQCLQLFALLRRYRKPDSFVQLLGALYEKKSWLTLSGAVCFLMQKYVTN